MDSGRLQAHPGRDQVRQLDRGRSFLRDPLQDSDQTQTSLCAPELRHTRSHALHHHLGHIFHTVCSGNAARNQHNARLFCL